MLDVVRSGTHELRIIPEQAEGLVATLAQQPTDVSADMAMVHGKSNGSPCAPVDIALRSLAQVATTTLLIEHLAILFNGEVILLELEAFGRCVGLDLQAIDTVSAASADRIGASIEAVNRLDGVAPLAALELTDAVLAVPVVLAVVPTGTCREVLAVAVRTLPDTSASHLARVARPASVLLSPVAVVVEVREQLCSSAVGAPAMRVATAGANLLDLDVVSWLGFDFVYAVADLTDVSGGRHGDELTGNLINPEVGVF